jgi:hypothetical protein
MAELVERPVLLLVVSFAGLVLAAVLGMVGQRVWTRSGRGIRASSTSSKPPR